MSKAMDQFIRRTKRDLSGYVAPKSTEQNKPPQDNNAAPDAERCYHGPLPPDKALYRAELRHREYPANFLRPPFTQPAHTKEPLEFFVEQIDTVNTLTPLWDVLEKYKGRESVKRNYWSFFVRLFGTTAEGHNVCCYLSGFHPHIHVEVPHAWNDAHVEQWIEALEEEPGLDKLSWNLAQRQLVWRKNIYGFTKDTPIRMLKMAFKNMSTKRKLCDLLRSEPKTDFDAPPPDRTKVPPQRYKYHGAPQHRFWLYDLSVSEPQQLLNETGIGGCRWVRLEGGAYEFHNMAHVLPHERRSRAQIDIDAPYGSVHVLHERKDVPPLLIYSFDSEVMRGARDRVFPKSHVAGDEQFQWGGSVMRFGDDFAQIPLFSAVHCVRPTDNLQPQTTHINEYADERSMLDAYLRFFRDAVNPSVVLGYNTYGFDYQYWEDRAKRCLGSAHCERNLPYKYGAYARGSFEYGVVRGELTEARQSYGGSKAHGQRETCQLAMAGRTQIDLYKWAAEEWKMPRTLNWVGEDTFNDASRGDASLCRDDFVKIDLPFWVIHDKYVGTTRDRGEIAAYCAVDTHVPLRIMHVKKVLLGVIEIARLTGLTMHEVINKKQMARTFAMISKYAHDRNYVIPECPQRFVLDTHLRDMMFGDGSYQGATVIEPVRGYYDAPVGTLDYAGLYPSIIRGFHLCYTTLVLDPKWLDDPDVEVRSIEIQSDTPGVAPYKLHWVTNTEPLLYGLLTEILDARANAKKLKKQHADNPFLHALYDARQLGLKLIANSTYGFTGAGKVGKLPNVALAASVTYHGRGLIELTRDIVHREQPECRVIYGDTDSVMIRFPKAWPMQRVFDVSHELADIVTCEIGRPEIVLEFEKVYNGYLLYMKKKYAGMKMESVDQKPRLAIKGLNPVRGDKMLVVKRVSEEILNALLIDKSPKKAIECLRAALQVTIDDKLPPSDFYQEKKLTKSIDAYPPNTVHVRVARAMRERDPGTAPGAGEMVKFLVVEGPLKVNAVDYEHFMKNRRRYRLDYEYYLQNLMLESLGDLLNLEGVHDDPYRLFEPYLALARVRKMRTPQITQFLVRDTSVDKAQFVQMRGMKRGPSKTKVKKAKERAKKEAR